MTRPIVPHKDIEAGDAVILRRYPMEKLPGVVMEVFPPRTVANEFEKEHYYGKEEHKFDFLETQQAYWRKQYNVDIGVPNFLLRVALHPAGSNVKLFTFPDYAIVQVLPNRGLRRFEKKRWRAYVRELREEHGKCFDCGEKIKFWQKKVKAEDEIMGDCLVHVKCPPRKSRGST